MPNIIDVIKDPSRLKEMFGTTPTLIGNIRIDVLTEEIPDISWEIPEQRIDVATSAADSRFKKPTGVTLDCVLLDPEYSVTKVAKGKVAGESFDNDDWRTKRDRLYELLDSNEVLTIITPSGYDYSDMMITSITPDIRQVTNNGFWFRISAKHVEFVSSEVRGIDQGLLPDELKKKKDDKSKRKQDKNVDKGNKTAIDGEKRKSILKAIYDKGLGLF